MRYNMLKENSNEHHLIHINPHKPMDPQYLHISTMDKLTHKVGSFVGTRRHEASSPVFDNLLLLKEWMNENRLYFDEYMEPHQVRVLSYDS